MVTRSDVVKLANRDELVSLDSVLNLVPLMTGDSGGGGTSGLMPAPPLGAAAAGMQLQADGTWGYALYPAVALAIAFGG
jgi:hypothetical protein